MTRTLIGFLVSAGVTFVLFIVMSFLVKVDGDIVESKKRPPIEINLVRDESNLTLKQRKIPDEPEPPEEPPPPQVNTVSEKVQVTQQPVDIDLSNIKLGSSGGVYVGGSFSQGNAPDGEAIPIFTIKPQWPRKALLEGINGWVRIQFDINPDGTISNPTVLDEEPRRLFRRDALRAIRKWKFKPKVVDGRPVTQKDKTYKLEFTLQDE